MVRAPGIAPGTADWQTAALLLRYARITKLAPASSGCWQAPEKIRQGRSVLRFRINNRRFLKEIGRLDGIRTRIAGLKDRHPLILDDEAKNETHGRPCRLTPQGRTARLSRTT